MSDDTNAHVSTDCDTVFPFQLNNSEIRGRLVRLDTLLRDIHARHQYPLRVQQYLSEAIALAIAIRDCFKFEGLLTLQIHGDGPIRLLVVDINDLGHTRACARYDNTQADALSTPDSVSIQQDFGQGYMTFTIDPQSSTEQYQGTVTLDGKTLAECAHHYFRQSEQLETGVVLYHATSTETYQAAALMLQRMPPKNAETQADAVHDRWVEALSLIGSTHAAELLDPGLSSHEILYRLFWEKGVRVFPPHTLTSQCRCSAEKVHIMLAQFKPEDREEMLTDEKTLAITCEFCSTEYIFTLQDFSVDKDVPGSIETVNET